MRQRAASMIVAATAAAACLIAFGPLAEAATPAWTPVSTLVSTNGKFDYSYTPITVSDSTDRSTVLTVDNHGLEAFTRAPQSPSFSPATLLSGDGDFASYIDGSGESATSLADGTVVVAWPADNFTRIDAATLAPGASSWVTSTVATGSNLAFVQAAGGGNSVAALVWTDGSSVYSSSLPSAQAKWTSPSVASDPVPGDAYPLLEDPLVAVGSSGSLTVTWNAYDGEDGNGQDIYRAKGATLPAAGGQWSTPQWISPADADQPVLTAGTDGSVTELWADGAGGLDAASLVDGTWGTPTAAPMGAHGGQARLTAGPAGVYDSVWTEGGYNQIPLTLQGDTYTASGGWGIPAAIDTPGNALFDDVQVLSAADGTTTAVWSINSSQTGDRNAYSSTRGSSGWSAARRLADLGPSLAPVDAAISPSGLLSVAYNVATMRAGTNDFDYALSATSQFHPVALATTSAPTIHNVVKVGNTLVVTRGTWNAAPTSYSYQWRRNGTPIPNATRSLYKATLADAGTRLTATVTAHRAGYPDGTSLSDNVTVPRPAIRNTARPTITGNPTHGNILTAHPGRWTPSPTAFRYQWLRNGKPIAHAEHTTYRSTSADRGHTLTVRVTAQRSPYASETAASEAVKSLDVVYQLIFRVDLVSG